MKKLWTIIICVLLLTVLISSTAFAAEPGSEATGDGFMMNLAIAILLPLLIAFIVCSVFKSQMKTARIAKTATNYIPPGGFNLTKQEDTFLYQTRTRVKVNTPPPPSSGSTPPGNKTAMPKR